MENKPLSSFAALMYHHLSLDRKMDGYSVPVSEFREQLRHLRDNGFNTIGIEGLASASIEKPVMITFDDGYETDCTEAYPLLREHGFVAVHFLTAGFMGKQGYLNWQQVKKLSEEGFSVQSHTLTHPLLPYLSKSALTEELSLSKKMIEDRTGARVSALSLPGGRYNKRVVETAYEQGYTYIFTSRPGINRQPADDLLDRVLVSGKTGPAAFAMISALDERFYRKEKLKYIVKSALQKIAGPRLYHTLWERMNG
jgi:peptidoglycan/xylan/chitin deacetylase (PgdA/CDA1 family)